MYKVSMAVILSMPKIGELIQQDRYWRGTQSLLDAMAVLYDCNNNMRGQTVAISHESFYIPQITEKVNIAMDYKNWYMAAPQIRVVQIFFCK